MVDFLLFDLKWRKYVPEETVLLLGDELGCTFHGSASVVYRGLLISRAGIQVHIYYMGFL